MDYVETVLKALRDNYESELKGWGCVYLDNARPKDMSVTTFRAALSQLSKKGLYRVIDGHSFGDVKLED